MFNPNNFFHAFFIIPILNILVGLYSFLNFLHIPFALGLALILLTVLIRLVLHPLTIKQLKSAKKLAKLKPELDNLAKIYKDDKTRLHQEQLKLYQRAGINPAAGCLPLLLQMPILIALYNLFFQLLNNGNMANVVNEVNKVVYFPILKISSLDLNFFGLSLAVKPSQWQTKGFLLLLIPIATALFQYWQTRLMSPPVPSSADKQIEKKDGSKDAKKDEDMGQMMQKQMGIMMPLMIGFFAYSFPLGLSLYWNTFTLFGIIQQVQINKAKD